MSTQPKDNQHTTPKCYLKNFSDDKKFIFRKFKKADSGLNNDLNVPVALSSIPTKDNVYTIYKGNEPYLIETTIYERWIENYYLDYYKMLVNQDEVGLSKIEDRAMIFKCLLSLHCRTPKQFRFFFENIPNEYKHEEEKIKEDYKVAHLQYVFTNFVEAHQYKIFKIAKITDTSGFITSDNPVLIVNSNNELVNHLFREQFNTANKIYIPLDTKHCCILENGSDKNGISLEGRLFYSKFIRVDVDCTFTQKINELMLESADEYYFGSEKYIKSFFGLYKLI